MMQDDPKRIRPARVHAPQRAADLFHLGDQLQPARHRPVGAQLPLHQLHRLLSTAAIPSVRARRSMPHAEFESIEDINNYLLQHKEVIDHDPAARRQAGRDLPDVRRGDRGDLQGASASRSGSRTAKLRQRCDNKMETVRIGNKARVASVPNALGPRRRAMSELMQVAEKAGIGTRSRRADRLRRQRPHHLLHLQRAGVRPSRQGDPGEDEVKIMKRIKCRGATMEACATRSGTLVGPLLTEVVGTQRADALQGRLVRQRDLSRRLLRAIRNKARDMAFRFGNQLVKEGYRGYFDLDFLIDEKDGEVYLGELNPRICGASSMTNHAAFAYADAPLFLFHLLEFSGIKYKIDVEELNERWAQEGIHRFLVAAGDEVHRRERRHRHQCAADRRLPHGGRRLRCPMTASTIDRQAIESETRGVLPAHHRARRLSLRGRRSRHPDHPRPRDGRRFRAERAGAQLDQGHQEALRRQAADWKPQVEEAPAAGSFKIL